MEHTFLREWETIHIYTHTKEREGYIANFQSKECARELILLIPVKSGVSDEGRGRSSESFVCCLLVSCTGFRCISSVVESASLTGKSWH